VYLLTSVVIEEVEGGGLGHHVRGDVRVGVRHQLAREWVLSPWVHKHVQGQCAVTTSMPWYGDVELSEKRLKSNFLECVLK